MTLFQNHTHAEIDTCRENQELHKNVAHVKMFEVIEPTVILYTVVLSLSSI